jgi:hypothetical protein
MRNRVASIIISYLIISTLLSSSLCVYSAEEDAKPISTFSDLFNHVSQIEFHYNVYNETVISQRFGYEITGEEIINGQSTWKIEFVIGFGGNESLSTFWVSQDTGQAIKAEIDGEILEGFFVGSMANMTFWLMSAMTFTLWQEWDPDYISSEVLDYGEYTFLGSGQETYGPTTLSLEKYRYTGIVTAPEDYRYTFEIWTAETKFGSITTYWKAESLFESEWIEMELISIELMEEPIIPEEPSAKPEFVVSDLNIEPDALDIGGTVSISVKVSNTGDASGSKVLTLKIDGNIEDETSITLKPDETKTAYFEYETFEEGTININVNDLSGSLSVTKPSVQEPETGEEETKGGGGIPGFPFESIIFGLILGALIMITRSRTHPLVNLARATTSVPASS